MSIAGASGDQSHAVICAVAFAASRISSPVGNDCQKSFTLIASPPLTSPTKANPDARRPASANTHVLCGLVRLVIVNPSGVGCDSV